jgi:hypothetical protein
MLDCELIDLEAYDLWSNRAPEQQDEAILSLIELTLYRVMCTATERIQLTNNTRRRKVMIDCKLI